MVIAGTVAIMPLLAASEPLERQRAVYEKELTKLGKELPIAHMADRIKGVNTKTLAVIVGECGDLSAYEKGIAGIWKRAGLAVIDGERQRKKASKEEALIHGYSPSRRSVFWNIGDALLKSQGKEENRRSIPADIRCNAKPMSGRMSRATGTPTTAPCAT